MKYNKSLTGTVILVYVLLCYILMLKFPASVTITKTIKSIPTQNLTLTVFFHKLGQSIFLCCHERALYLFLFMNIFISQQKSSTTTDNAPTIQWWSFEWCKPCHNYNMATITKWKLFHEGFHWTGFSNRKISMKAINYMVTAQHYN